MSGFFVEAGSGDVPMIQKSPGARLEYWFDWAGWLSASETISTATWTAYAGLTLDTSSVSGTKTLTWISGGTHGSDYLATVTITTSAGRVDSRSFTIRAWARGKGAPSGIPTYNYEPALGNPSMDGYVLASTAAGVRTWVAQSGGPGGDMLSTLLNAEISITGTNTATISTMHVCSGTSADYTLTLPAVSGNTGKFLGVRMSSALTKLVTLDGNGSELIDGALTRIMWANESAILYCDGATWTKVGGKTIPMSTGIKYVSNLTFAASVATLIPCDASYFSLGPAAMQNLGSNNITILRPGAYNVGVRGVFSNNNTSATFIQVTLNKNGASAWLCGNNQNASAGLTIQFNTQFSLASNDALTFIGSYNTGSFTTTVLNSAVLTATEVPTW